MIRQRQLRLLGHVARFPGSGPVSRVISEVIRPVRRRPSGRPRSDARELVACEPMVITDSLCVVGPYTPWSDGMKSQIFQFCIAMWCLDSLLLSKYYAIKNKVANYKNPHAKKTARKVYLD